MICGESNDRLKEGSRLNMARSLLSRYAYSHSTKLTNPFDLQFANCSEAVTWLIDQGVAANRDNIDKIIQAYKAIENLRHQAPTLMA